MKKILIFTSHGGGGHTSVTQALTQYLENDYEVSSSLVFSDVLGPIDPGQIASFKAFTGESLYNFFMRHKLNRVIEWMYRLGRWYFSLTQKTNRKLIKNYVEKHKPDALISVCPLINGDVLAVSQECSLPFILVPTDLDAKTFVTEIEKPTYDKFIATRAFDDPQITQTFSDAQLQADQLVTTGFPLRKDFFELKDVQTLRRAYGVPDGKQALLLLMGSVGSGEIASFTQALAQCKQPVHLLICLGKNKRVEKRILNIIFPSHISFTTIGFTDRISDLLAISNLFITKSGTVSFCEGLYMHVPMLLDATTTVLPWERFNHEFLVRHRIGQVIKDRKNIPVLVDHLLSQPVVLEQMRHKMELLTTLDGGESIRELLQKKL